MGLVRVRQGGASVVLDPNEASDLRVLALFYRFAPQATSRGRARDAADMIEKQYLQGLSMVEVASRRASERDLRAIQASLDAAARDPARLADVAATDRALILAEIDDALLSVETIRDWERDPSCYIAAPLFAIFLVSSRDFAPLAERSASIAARLELLPELLRDARANLRNPPRVLTEIAIEETEGAIEFCSTLIPQLAQQLPRPPRALLRAASRASRALYEYLDFLRDDLMLVSTGRLGIGAEAFEAKLRFEHMLPYTLDEIKRTGQRVFEETRRELEELARRIDAGRTWHEIMDEARREYPASGRVLAAYRKELEHLKGFIRERDLVTLPDEECEVIETPPFERALNSYAAYVAPGPFETDPRGQFWVTPVDPTAPRAAQIEQLEEHCNYLYPITAAHEGYPGHHVQLARANHVGSRWRKHFSSSLFAEGWALYCEGLMDEVGYYREPRMKLFQLKDRLWRAARVTIEIGLHCENLPLDDAARMLVEEVGMTPTAARAETRRYVAEPTQPLSYLMGELEVFKLRRKYSALGLREFHDRLLSSGTIPFALVEKELQNQLER
jgi:uncharacterized protein (DUF885 family)